MTPRLALHASEAAEALGVDVETIRRALLRGELPGRKLDWWAHIESAGSVQIVTTSARDGAE